MNNIKGYAPYGARSLQEFAIREEFFDQNGVGIRVFILVIPKNGTNMLTEENLKEAVEVPRGRCWSLAYKETFRWTR